MTDRVIRYELWRARTDRARTLRAFRRGTLVGRWYASEFLPVRFNPIDTLGPGRYAVFAFNGRLVETLGQFNA